jgi:hypothetical protein
LRDSSWLYRGLNPLLLRPPQPVGLNLARKADNAALIACAKKFLSCRQHHRYPKTASPECSSPKTPP